MAAALSLATLVLQAGILLVLLVALRRQNVPAAVNASVSLAATLVPLLVGIATGLGLEPTVASGLPLWIALAGVLHSVGMLGPYDSVPWWDVMTHAVSSALVAALVYAAALVVLAPSSQSAASTTVVALTLGVTAVLGVFWELIELVAREFQTRYGIEPVLVHYGWRDTAVDLVVDLAGAVAVVALDLRAFVPVLERVPGLTQGLLAGTAGVAVLGSLAMAVWIRWGGAEAP